MAGEPQAVGGISIPLTLDPSGWSAGLRRARADLEQLRREAAQLSSPAAQARRAPVTAGGIGVPAGIVPQPGAPVGNLATVGGVSPRFNVTAGSVRDMRIEINRQLRTLAGQGEAVAIPVKLGRVPYSAMRQEISAGIGEVPVKITLDPGAIASLRGQVMRAIGLSAPGAGGPVQGITRRATGGPAMGGRDILVGEQRPEILRLPPGMHGQILPYAAGGLVAGRYSRSQAMSGLTPQQGNFNANIMAAVARLQPHHLQGGIDWYRQMAEYARRGASKYGVSQQTSVGVLAALSAGTEWQSNKTKYERIMAAHSRGQPFPYSMDLDAHRKAQAILNGLSPEKAFATSPKVGQFYRAGMGDLSSLVIDLWATRTATLGGMNQPGRARPGIEAAFRRGAKKVGLQNAEFQAALWLLEKEESLQAPGQMGMGFARGGLVPGQMGMGMAAKFPRSRPFCTVCNTTMANEFDHRATAKHKANMARRVGQGGVGRERPYWMLHPNTRAELEDAHYEELEREQGASYPGDIWRPMARGGRMRGAGFVPGLRSIAQGYNRMVGLPPMQEQMLHPLFPDFSRRTAAAYERMPVGPDALSRRAYKAFGEETEAQYEYLQRAGFRFEPDPGDPYTPGPGDKLTKMQLAAQDVRRNKRLLAFSSALEHPLLTNEQNLKFRHVHDMMGHLAEGYSIGPRGEFNAAVKHSQMFTPLARMAMLAETHGQNSVVNFSPTVLPGFGGRSIADVNKAAPGTIYAQQKAQRLPEDILEEFYRLTGLEGRAGGGPVEHYLNRMKQLEIFKREMRDTFETPEGWTSTRGRTVGGGFSPIGKILSKAFGSEQRAAALGEDIDLNAALARLPTAMREPGMSRRALSRQALRGMSQSPEDIDLLARKGMYEPFQRLPLEPDSAGKYRPIDPRWLPRERIDPAFLEKNAAGGPVVRSLTYADPNGLHMRPATALAKVGQMAQLSGNPIRVSAGGRSISFPATGSVLGWMQLGARQGTKMRFEVGGTESERVVKLLEQLLGFAGPEATGQSYSQFHGGLGVGTAAVEAIEKRMSERSATSSDLTRLLKRAGGGQAKGVYRVNELGEEKFVPDRLAHKIPPDVAAQIPGGGSLLDRLNARNATPEEPWKPEWLRRKSAKDLTGRAAGGIIQIPGRDRVWAAPEDGWIIPARLAGKIPARQGGGDVFGGGGFEAGMAEEERKRQQRAQIEATERYERLDRARAQSIQLRREAAAQRNAIFRNLPNAPNVGGATFTEELQAARLSATLNRGYSGSSGFGAAVAGIFGGRQERQRSLIEGQAFQRQYESFLPKGAARGSDPLLYLGEQLQELEDRYEKQTKVLTVLNKDYEANTDEIEKLSRSMRRTKRDIGTTNEAIDTAGRLRQRAEESFAKAQGGTARNILSLTAAGFAYSTAAQALETGLQLATKAAEPFIDQLTGFSSTSIRVTKSLAEQARQQGGNIPAAIAGAAGTAGVGAGGLDYLTRALSGSVAAKAGAAAADEATDLLRAAAGAGNAPTGLFGGFGGVGGTPAFAEFLGGGKGFTEVLAGAVGGFRLQQERGAEGARLERKAIFGNESEAQAQERNAAAGFEALNVTVKDYNDAATRGARALGEHTTGLRLATREQLGLTEATDDELQRLQTLRGEQAGDKGNAEALSKAGVFLVDAAGRLVEGTTDYRKFFEQSARGRSVQSETAFAAQQRQQLLAQRGLNREQTRFATDIGIPGELGQQILAQPFIRAEAGIPQGERAPLSARQQQSLRETNRLQDELIAGAKQAVEVQAQFIDQNTGRAQGQQFRGYVSQISEIGDEIASITEEISNRQAQASYASFANNIRLINRSLADARGLATGQGGANNLGVIQRQQFMLSRESQKLSLESQRLQLQSNELQLQLSQRQINFQRAVAGFQAPGITGQERAARMAEAELEASFAQRQLNIGRQQQGISGQQLGISGEQMGLELRAFTESAKRAVVDLEAQRALVVQQYQLEQEQIIAQRRINALTTRQGQLQAKASAIFQEASGNFNAGLASAAQYAAQFGGTMAAAIIAVRKALTARPGTYGSTGGTAAYPGNQTPHAAGYSATVDRPTSFIAGEAGSEHVMVIRNPSFGTMGPAAGGGGGWSGGNHITINISGNQFGADLTAGDVARQLADEVERRFETKARLLNVNA